MKRVLTSPGMPEPEACAPHVEIECAIRFDEDNEIGTVLIDGKRCTYTRKLPPKEIVMWVMSDGQVRGYSQEALW